ncbi:stage III sporulation protein AG [Alicyclobacillus contaminans]|uniref:hypothetical protein n=1 Tax=Alicyclobacillus contaminans TaxID=392016 RepID=UPI00041ADC9F|nr:hypothetical protein [Alicyclobacillus contaminans]GMA52395.1 stage III sporulation protein AG [Alicyclobacillus contaminans]
MDWRILLKNKWLLVLAVLGVVCLLLGSFWKPRATTPTVAAQNAGGNTPSEQASDTASGSQSVASYEAMYDKRLEEMLGQIAGIHQVDVMVTLDTTNSVKVATNTQETKQSGANGATSSTTVNQEIFTQTNPDGSRTPYVEETLMPQVRGVLVVVNADDFFVAKSEIVNAVSNVLDVPAYKISVEPKQSNS